MRVVWATKGLEARWSLITKMLPVKCGGNEIPLAVLSGPFAKELAGGFATAIAVASTDNPF